MIWRAKLLIRTRAALVAGTLVALALAVVFIAVGRGRTSPAWFVPLIALLLALIAQLMLDSREALRRERRLVRTAAALREATAQLEKLAATDPLTGIWNRRAFFEAFGVEFRRAQRYGRNLSVLMIDLDNFKQANDLGGHAFARLRAVGDVETDPRQPPRVRHGRSLWRRGIRGRAPRD